MAAIFDLLFTKLKPTCYLSQYVNRPKLTFTPLVKSIKSWAQLKCYKDKNLNFESEAGLRPFMKSAGS